MRYREHQKQHFPMRFSSRSEKLNRSVRKILLLFGSNSTQCGNAGPTLPASSNSVSSAGIWVELVLSAPAIVSVVLLGPLIREMKRFVPTDVEIDQLMAA